jgi:cation diffusion facilitator CzcD-associated flavoprotein CzcO
VWVATPDLQDEQDSTIPRTAPRKAALEPVWRGSQNGKDVKAENLDYEFVSAVYDLLRTNLPKDLMCYDDSPFPSSAPLYPSHQTVREYVESYGEELRDFVKFETQVVDVFTVEHRPDARWSVTTRNVRTGTQSTEAFDAVIVASGHFDDPYVPDIPGLEDWNRKLPGSITHSKYYRRPEQYADKVGVLCCLLRLYVECLGQRVSF